MYEAALLVEAGRVRELDGLLLVEAPIDDRLRRLIARDGIDEAAARRMIAAQATDDERRRAATETLANSGDVDALRAGVRAFIQSRGWSAPA